MTPLEALERRCLLSYPVPTTGLANIFGEQTSDIDVATAPDGRSIVVAHVVRQDIPAEQIMAIRFDADGKQIGSAFTLVSWPHVIGEGSDTSPLADPKVSVSMDANANAIVAYTAGPSSSLTTDSVYVSRISNTGIVSNPLLISAPTPRFQDQLGADISMDAAGGFFVGWIQTFISDGSEGVEDYTNVQVAVYDASNHKLGETSAGGSINDEGDPDSIDLAAYRDGSGAVYAIARNYSLADSNTNRLTDTIEYGRLDANANRIDQTNRILNDVQWSVPFFKESDGQVIDDANEPAIAINDDFTFEIAYRRYVTDQTINDDSVQAAYVQRFHANGDKRGGPIELFDGLTGDGIRTGTYDPGVAALPGGGFVAAFVQITETNRGPEEMLYTRTYSAPGQSDTDAPLGITFRAPGEIDNTGENSAPPLFITTDALGHANLAWVDPVAYGLGLIAPLTSDLASIEDSTLNVQGTSSDDNITISVDGMNLLVTRNDQSATFKASDVTAIHVNALAGNDTVTNNTSIPSTIEGGDGDDTLFGGSSDDRLDGGAGSDSLWGEGGNDRLAGDDGHDYLFGNGGNDKIYGGLQPDFIRGNAGHDQLYGNGGNDRLYGGASNDSLYGQGGNDQLFGEGGNDRLYADYGSGSSTLHGGAGNDILISKNGLTDQLFGDGGNDSSIADANDVLTSIEVTG